MKTTDRMTDSSPRKKEVIANLSLVVPPVSGGLSFSTPGNHPQCTQRIGSARILFPHEGQLTLEFMLPPADTDQ